MSVFTPEEITELAANSEEKSSFITTPMLILGFLAVLS